MAFKETINNFKLNFKGFFNNHPSYTEQADLPKEAGIFKAYIPNFLYKPPYGYPRMIDVPQLRKIAVSPYVSMISTTIIDEVCSVPWEIIPKKQNEPGEDVDKSTETHIEEVKEFFYNPNKNGESFEFILRAATRDIIELDSGIIVKVFNRAGKMVQIFARDGGTFLKNPDIYGYIGNRAEFVFPTSYEQNNETLKSYYDTVLRRDAAYFQYGWTAGAMPVAFGNREIIWLSKNARSDSIYGRSIVEVVQDVALSLIYGSIYNLDFYTNNNMPDGVISLLGADQESISKFRKRWEKQFKKRDTYGKVVKQFHKYPIVNQDAKFVPFQLTSQDLEVLSQQQWFTKIIWACFGVTPTELGFTQDSNKSTELVQSKVFKRKAIKPLLKLWEYYINRHLIPEFGYDDIEFKFNDFDVAEEVERAKLFEIQLQNGIRTKNEVRLEMGLMPLEEDEQENEENLDKRAFNNEKEEEEEERGQEIEKPIGEEENIETEEKALDTEQPVILKENEKPLQLIKKYYKEKEKEILEIIDNLYKNRVVNEIKSLEFKNDITSLINKIEGTLNVDNMKKEIESFVRDSLFKSMEKEGKKLDMNFIPREDVLNFLKDYNFNLIKDLSKEMENDLRSSLERLYMNNAGSSQIKEEISKIFDKGNNRAKVIFRTETDRLDNIGKLEAAKQSPLDLKKALRIVDDERTTPLCKRLNKKYEDNPIELNEKFVDNVTGESWESPPFHCNCRSGIRTVQKEK